MSGVLLAAAEVEVGDHTQWHIAGLTFNADTVISSLTAGAIVLAFGLYLRRKATHQVPSGLQLTWETVVRQVEDQVEESLGIRTAPFVVPLGIALFFFILVADWLTIVPHAFESHVYPPTADVNLTFALAFLVIIMVHVTGVRVKGKHYFRHFFEPYPWLFPINLIEEIAKPFTLALRLFGNLFAGVVMVGILALMPAFVLWLPTTAWKLFDLFIGLIQAFIFALLTIMYFGFAAGPDEESEARSDDSQSATPADAAYT